VFDEGLDALRLPIVHPPAEDPDEPGSSSPTRSRFPEEKDDSTLVHSYFDWIGSIQSGKSKHLVNTTTPNEPSLSSPADRSPSPTTDMMDIQPSSVISHRMVLKQNPLLKLSEPEVADREWTWAQVLGTEHAWTGNRATKFLRVKCDVGRAVD